MADLHDQRILRKNLFCIGFSRRMPEEEELEVMVGKLEKKGEEEKMEK